MLHLPTPTQNATRVRPSRRRWGSYRHSIEQRAAAAAIMIKDGWGPKHKRPACSASVLPMSPSPGSSVTLTGAGLPVVS